MRVIFFQPLGDGGIAHYTHNLMQALAGEGAEVRLVTSVDYEFRRQRNAYAIDPVMFRMAGWLQERIPWLRQEYPLPSRLRRAVKALEYPLDALTTLRIVRQRRPAAVHIQTVQLSELLLVWLLRMQRTRVVFTIHNIRPLHRRMRWYHRRLLRHLYSLCDRIIIHTTSGKDEAVELFGIEADKIQVIPHGDYKFFNEGKPIPPPEAKLGLGIAAQARTVLFFGAIRPNKGLDVLLRALGRIRREVPDVVLLVVGEPCEDYAKYRKLIEDCDLRANVRERLDYVPNDEVARYFAAADLVVLPYREITQSGVLQIAYAFGKPVVATSIGGFVESVEAGRNGVLVPVDDAEALGTQVSALLRDPERLDLMGRRSRELSDQEYSWSEIARRTMGVYAAR